MTPLFLLPGAVASDKRVAAWFAGDDALRALARPWFARARACGAEVRETLHDGQPTACLGDAAFLYVDAFAGHANVGFFHGADLDDPAGLLEGSGKRMRHVKLRPSAPVDAAALDALIASAYRDIAARIAGAG
jgi:hypothetical protein